MKDQEMVTFDEHGVFEIHDASLLEAVVAGVGATAAASTGENQTCGSDINQDCGSQTNGACSVVINGICGQNESCGVVRSTPQQSVSVTTNLAT